MPSFELRRRIRWSDADPAGRLYYARMFDYFGEAEHELFRDLGIGLRDQYKDYDFPRVNVQCEFRRVLSLDDTFILRVTVGRVGRTSICLDFTVLSDGPNPEVAAKGSVTVVVVKDQKPVEIPADLRSRLETGGTGHDGA